MKSRSHSIVGLLALLWVPLCSLVVAADDAPPPYTRYFISDLHLGVGRDEASGDWLPFEDFRWHSDFLAFLNEIGKSTGDHAELVILGDFLELWQSANLQCSNDAGLVRCEVTDCRGDKPELGCSEQEALARMRRIAVQHSDTLKELGKFASRGSNRLVIVPGNHDAPLLLPAASRQLAATIDAAPGRLIISEKGYWLSDDGRILGEHGHQFDKVNLFRKWPIPFETAGVRRLERPWGELMVQDFYNQYEYQFPAIDNLSGESEGIRYALSALHARGAAVGANRFFSFLLLDTSLRQKVDFLGKEKNGNPRAWDVAAVKQNKGTDFLISGFDVDDPSYAAIQTAFATGQITVRPSDLEQEEIEELCDNRVLLQEKYREAKRPIVVEQCPLMDRGKNQNLGYVVDKVLKRDRVNLVRYLRARSNEIEAQTGSKPPIDVYVFGHTHSATRGEMMQIGLGWKSLAINTGAFQRLADSVMLKTLVKEKALRNDEVLTRIRVEDFKPCYSYIRVDPYDAGKAPNPVLRYWTLRNAKWQEAANCN